MNIIQRNIKTKYLPLLTVVLALLVTLSPFAIDSYLAAMPVMATVFNVHLSVVELTVTLYFLGFSLGNFFGGPLSDSFGRKPTALTGIALYGISSLFIPSCSSIELIIVLRIFQAFGGGFATVTANLFIRDWFEGDRVAKLVTVVSMMMMLAPLFAPVIGAVLISWKGWVGVFYFMSILATALFIIFLTVMPESRNKEFITRSVSKEQLLGKYKIFFSDRLSVIILFAVSFSMVGLYIFLTGASFIYMEFFKIERNLFPILFGSNVLLNILLSLLNTYLLKFYPPRYLVRAGMLLQLLAGGAFFTTAQFSEPSFWAVFASIVLFVGSLGLVFGNGTAVILNLNPKVAGSANATIGIMRFLLSFIIGSIIAMFHASNLVPIATGMFVCTVIGNILFVISLRYRNQIKSNVSAP